ncbi:MAG: phosphatase PAP2 family protein [Gemmatimonadales bacterium]|jgi:membrane-associated phospholipid phosphatase
MRTMLRVFLAGAALLAAADSADAQLQVATTFVAPVEVEAGSAPAGTALPQLHELSDIALGGVSLAGIAIGLELPVTRQSVPGQGLDPSTIGWGIDRDIVGHPSTSADQASDVFLLATVLGPPLLALATQPGVHDLGERVRRPIVLYGQSLLLAEACVQLLKPAADRARPFTYLPASERPSDGSYDVTTRDAFVSMPSGHSAVGFAAAAYAATDNLLARPGAGTAEHVAVASVGALLAGFTGSLRVRADQHFPTDAVVGSLIGTASGVSVPMLHHYLLPDGRRAPHPGGHAWLMSAGGYVVGAALGAGLSSVVY